MATSDTLKKELDKSDRRLAERKAAVDATNEIISSTVALPSLKIIAEKRLVRLERDLEDERKINMEIRVALGIANVSQSDAFPDPKPQAPVRRPPARAQ